MPIRNIRVLYSMNKNRLVCMCKRSGAEVVWTLLCLSGGERPLAFLRDLGTLSVRYNVKFSFFSSGALGTSLQESWSIANDIFPSWGSPLVLRRVPVTPVHPVITRVLRQSMIYSAMYLLVKLILAVKASPGISLITQNMEVMLSLINKNVRKENVASAVIYRCTVYSWV